MVGVEGEVVGGEGSEVGCSMIIGVVATAKELR